MSRGQGTYGSWAHLYDVAFSWDVAEEVDWLLARFGKPVRKILEPACGSGRMFPTFAQRGVEIVGVELSETMIRRARQRMAALGLPPPRVLHADMTRFELGETFDGAICPINSVGYLLSDAAALSHLESVARHLAAAGKYLVQLDLMDTSVSIEYARDDKNQWEVECDGLRVRTTWGALSFDAATRLQTEFCRFEILAGSKADVEDEHVAYKWKLPSEFGRSEVLAGVPAGTVIEDQHVLRKWSWEQWRVLIAASPFRLAAVYDGQAERKPLKPDESVEDAELTWYELVLAET